LYLLLWKESLRRNGAALIVNKRDRNAVLGGNPQNSNIPNGTKDIEMLKHPP